jgi:hypothetical protein
MSLRSNARLALRKGRIKPNTHPSSLPGAPWVHQCQFEFGFCVECIFSQRFIILRARNSASLRDPNTTLPFISTPVG